ncbi:MAG: alpha/beta hydrolase [Acidimicrobiia bacterium]
MSATVVLVHGAWHGAWCFDPVRALLDDAGVTSIAIDLPGHGKDSGPFTDLHGDAKRVTEVLDTIDGDVVLLGHSYGGAVIGQVGPHRSLRHLVFLAALALEEGETGGTAGWFDPAIVDIDHEGRPDAAAHYVRHPDSVTTVSAEGVRDLLYSDCDDSVVAWALDHMGPHPMETFRQEATTASWKSIESTYVVCTEDLILHPDLQRLMAKRCTHTIEWTCGHCPNASQPERVAELLIELATR